MPCTPDEFRINQGSLAGYFCDEHARAPVVVGETANCHFEARVAGNINIVGLIHFDPSNVELATISVLIHAESPEHVSRRIQFAESEHRSGSDIDIVVGISRDSVTPHAS